MGLDLVYRALKALDATAVLYAEKIFGEKTRGANFHAVKICGKKLENYAELQKRAEKIVGVEICDEKIAAVKVPAQRILS